MNHSEAVTSLEYLDSPSIPPSTYCRQEDRSTKEMYAYNTGYASLSGITIVDRPVYEGSSTAESYENISNETEIANLLPPWLLYFTQRLEEIANLSDDWDSCGTAAPNQASISNAMDILSILHETDLVPTQISPSVEEGIGISFVKGDKDAFVECYNDGEVLAVISDQQKERDIWQIRNSKEAFKRALETINIFINA